MSLFWALGRSFSEWGMLGSFEDLVLYLCAAISLRWFASREAIEAWGIAAYKTTPSWALVVERVATSYRPLLRRAPPHPAALRPLHSPHRPSCSSGRYGAASVSHPQMAHTILFRIIAPTKGASSKSCPKQGEGRGGRDGCGKRVCNSKPAMAMWHFHQFKSVFGTDAMLLQKLHSVYKFKARSLD